MSNCKHEIVLVTTRETVKQKYWPADDVWEDIEETVSDEIIEVKCLDCEADLTAHKREIVR